IPRVNALTIRRSVLFASGPASARFPLHCGFTITDTAASSLYARRHRNRGVHMKKPFLGSVALVAGSLGTSAAFAAHRGVPAYTPPPPPAPVYTWNGCYVGASAGWSQGQSQHFRNSDGAAITESFDLTGFIGGGQLGCNWQWGAWVFGIEGDGSATNKSGQGFELQPIPRPNTLWISETPERWVVTARGLLGLTNWWFGDRTRVDVTGGGAWAQIEA